MKKHQIIAVSGTAVAALAITMASTPAQADPHQGSPASGATHQGEPGTKAAQRDHDLPNPLGDKQRELRKEAVDKLLKGDATLEMRGGQRVIKLKGNAKAKKGSKAAKDKYVSYPVNREEDIFTILTDFGSQTKQPQAGTAGPVHNQIPKPDRTWDGSATDDNSTYWLPNFDTAHYQQMMFGQGESFKDFYQKQSNGRFLAKGDVSDWVSVPYNEARYGHNPAAGDGTSEADGYWNYVKDTATAWFDAQKKKGLSDAEIATYLKQFDKVDRYDYDGDGNFNEPDGYIDHFQAIHAGEGEEAGGGAQGADAIWSHRWYAFSNLQGKAGPEQNKLGGVPLGSSGLWIGDYTTEPENGGLGVFTHEFGHDLGLPDLYDTAGGDNGTGFWTLMSAGSWLNHGTDSIGTTPGYLGPWEKLQLGWLDYQQVNYGYDRNVKLGPADRDGKTVPQALLVSLPDKSVKTDYNTPHSGSYEWWSGSADNLNSTLTRTVDLTGKTSASLSAWTWYNTEAGYDPWLVEASTDGGKSWTTVDTLDGDHRSWSQKTWDLTPFAGSPVQVRFHATSDGGLHFQGVFLDDITVTADGATILSDDVESGDNGWTANGFSRMGGSTSKQVQHYDLAENRVYQGYDATLRTGPYNFGWASTRLDWVERFPYQNGLLVWYVDGQYEDNNTRTHPGHGLVLPVDARPAPVVFPNGTLLGNRRQPFDATFGQERTDPVTFHLNGVARKVPSQKALPTFEDAYPNKYWTADNPWNSVQTAGSGTTIQVASTSSDADTMNLKVRFK